MISRADKELELLSQQTEAIGGRMVNLFHAVCILARD